MSFNLKNISDFSDRLSFTLLSGVRNFPKVGPFGDDHQANLAIAFKSMIDSLPMVEEHLNDNSKFVRVKALLDNALQAYRENDRIVGGGNLNEILDIIAPNRYKDYEKRKGSRG